MEVQLEAEGATPIPQLYLPIELGSLTIVGEGYFSSVAKLESYQAARKVRIFNPVRV